jgi:hypothetical protein
MLKIKIIELVEATATLKIMEMVMMMTRWWQWATLNLLLSPLCPQTKGKSKMNLLMEMPH